MLEFATKNEKVDVWYISPTYKQSKAIMWSMLKELIPPEAVSKSNETELMFELLNGSRIIIKGGDTPYYICGVNIYFFIFVEPALF
jgi:hypothetical protein